MNTFILYCIATLISTLYFSYSLYQKEKQLFVFIIYFAKSKFYFCLAINFGIMVMVSLGKFLIKVFYGNVRLSEINRVIEKLRMSFFNFLLLFVVLRPKIDLSRMFLMFTYFFMAVFTNICFKRSAYVYFHLILYRLFLQMKNQGSFK